MPIREQVTIDEAVELLNSAVKVDPRAMHKLVESRVDCNKELADHPTIQVGAYHKEGEYTVGLLGILNGLFGIDDKGWGAIAAVFAVDCPNGHQTPENATVSNKCAVCDVQLELGNLIKFVRRDK